MRCDDDVIPQESRIESVGEAADLRDLYDTERQLLFVAYTRARDVRRVRGVEPASEELEAEGWRGKRRMGYGSVRSANDGVVTMIVYKR